MRSSIVMILACFFIIPFFARSQNEGIKTVPNPDPVRKAPMHDKTTQQMSLMQQKTTTGGATSPSGLASTSGGIYLEPGWAPGRVMLSDGSTLEDIQLRYDLYHQQVQFVKDEDTLAFSKPEEIKYFILNGRNFIYTDFENSESTGKGYFEVLSEGDCRLLAHRGIKYHIDSESRSLLNEDLYVRECEYYILKDENAAKQIKACRKSVLCAFKDKEDQVREYMKENNLNMKTCDQLKQVVEYYNGLP